MAIRNFRHRGLERLFVEDTARGVSPAMAPKIKRMLFALANASDISDKDNNDGDAQPATCGGNDSL